MTRKKNWDEFVNFVRSSEPGLVKKLMKESLEEDLKNFLFLANSQGPDAIVIRGMHYPDSDLLDEDSPTIFETSDKNIYIAAFRESSINLIMDKIKETVDEKLHDAVWEKSLEYMLEAAEMKIDAGDIRSFM